MPVVDDYSDGDLTEYQQDGSAYIWAGKLRVHNDDSSGRSEYCTSLAGLPVYPSLGDTITLDIGFGVPDDVTSHFMFGIDEHGPFPAGYELSLNGSQNQFSLVYRDAGGATTVVLSDSVSLTDTVPVTIAWRSGSGPAESYVHQSGVPVVTGSHGQHGATYVSGTPMRDSGGSEYVHESGTGIDTGAGHAFEVTVNGVTATGEIDQTGVPSSGGIGFSVGTYSGLTYSDRAALFDNIMI